MPGGVVVLGMLFALGLVYLLGGLREGIMAWILVTLGMVVFLIMIMCLGVMKTAGVGKNGEKHPVLCCIGWGTVTCILGILTIYFAGRNILDIPYAIKPENVILHDACFATENIDEPDAIMTYYRLKGYEEDGDETSFYINKSRYKKDKDMILDSVEVYYLPHSRHIIQIKYLD